MDPPAMMNEGSFTNSNVPPYNLAEIWQFPMNGGEGVGVFGRGLGLGSAQFGDVSGANQDVSGSDPMSLDLRANHSGGGRGGANGGGAKNRRDLDDESAKGVSTSNIGNGNGAVCVRNSSTFLY
jgi:hypothetical protein